MPELSNEQLKALKALSTVGTWGCARPGSNFLPMTCLETRDGDVDGEVMDALYRLGLLAAVHVPKDRPHTIGDCEYGPYGYIPAIELDWDWSVTEAGLRALPAEQKGGGSDG